MSSVMIVMAAALATELLLVLLGLLLYAWIRERAARRRDNQAMRVLVKRIKDASGERETAIQQFLAERVGLAGEPLEQARVAIRRAELGLLTRFAGIYKKRDAGAAAQFDIDVAAAMAPYFEFQGAVDGGDAAQASADPSELEDLRAKNVRLSEELSVTMETMARMLNEYSTMFAGGAAGEVVPTEVPARPAPTSAETSPSPQALDDIEVDIEGVAEEEASESPAPDASGDPEGPPAATVEADVHVLADDQVEHAPEGLRPDDIDALLAAEGQHELVDATSTEELLARPDDEGAGDVLLQEAPGATTEAMDAASDLEILTAREAAVPEDPVSREASDEAVEILMQETPLDPGEGGVGTEDQAPEQLGAAVGLPKDEAADTTEPEKETGEPAPMGSITADPFPPGTEGFVQQVEEVAAPALSADPEADVFDAVDPDVIAQAEQVLADLEAGAEAPDHPDVEDLFDAADPEVIAEVEQVLEELEAGANASDMEDLFDAVEEPLKTQSRP